MKFISKFMAIQQIKQIDYQYLLLGVRWQNLIQMASIYKEKDENFFFYPDVPTVVVVLVNFFKKINNMFSPANIFFCFFFAFQFYFKFIQPVAVLIFVCTHTHASANIIVTKFTIRLAQSKSIPPCLFFIHWIFSSCVRVQCELVGAFT